MSAPGTRRGQRSRLPARTLSRVELQSPPAGRVPWPPLWPGTRSLGSGLGLRASSLTGTRGASASSWSPLVGRSQLHPPHRAASALGPRSATGTTSDCPRSGPAGPHSPPCPARVPAGLLTQGSTRRRAAFRLRPRPTLPRAASTPPWPSAPPRELRAPSGTGGRKSRPGVT